MEISVTGTSTTDPIDLARLRRPRRIRMSALTVASMAVLAIMVVCAVGAPILFGYDPTAMAPAARFQGPSWQHPLGADQFGRDVATRLAYGARSSLSVAVAAMLMAGSIGVILGGLAGFYRGALDEVIMRVVDALLAFPAILLALLLVAAMGTQLSSVMIALGIVYIPSFARITRASFLTLREAEYVLAARTIGGRDRRLIWKHILPNALTPIIVQATLTMSFAVLAEAGLSFLGLGVQPPAPSWGTMLNEGRGFMRQSLTLSIFPGLTIALAVFSLNTLGDTLRDLLDPRIRNQG